MADLSTREKYITFLKHKNKFDKVMQEIKTCNRKTFTGFMKPTKHNEDLWENNFEDGLLAIYWYCRTYHKRENSFILQNCIPFMNIY